MKNGDGENYKPCAKIFSVMVDISCPHCEEVIALDDDASGVFACPFCEGEFEWNLEETDEGFDTEKYAPAPVLIQTGEKDMAMYSPPVSGGVALRWSMGLAITLMGIGVVIGSILAMFFSSQVAAIESESGFGEAAGTNIGAGLMIFSIILGVFGIALIVAGIGSIRRNFPSFIACTVLSVLGILGAIGSTFSYAGMDDFEKSFEPNPILGLLFWIAMVAGHMFVMFTPRGRMMWME